MSWFTSAWGQGGPFGWAAKAVDRNRDFAGNLLKNAAPFAAFIPGIGPLTAAGLAAAGGALGQGIQHGSNIGDIVKQGVTSAAEGSALKGLGAAFGAGSGGGAAAAPSATTSAADELLAGGNIAADTAAPAATAFAPSSAVGAATTGAALPKSVGERILATVGNIGSWSAKHPETVGQAFTALSNAGINEAQAKRLALMTSQDEYTLERQKARDAALLPIWQALAGKAQGFINNAPNTAARNPYAGGANPYAGRG